MPTPQLRLILEFYNSRLDQNGNRYWAFRAISTTTGLAAEGTVTGGESNIACLLRPLGLAWNQVHTHHTALGKREFRSLTKPWPHAGCAPEELATFVKNHIGEY